ncbi:MAG TPA: hypothetical protein VFV37_09960 [Luteibaculaceae bacterium]|nr:hypothetical protein [Luteibaculaceae bacterium]
MTHFQKQTEFLGHSGPIYCLSESWENHRFLSAGADKLVAHWDITEKQATPVAKTQTSIYSLQLLKSMDWLLIGQSDGHIAIVDYISRKVLRLIQAHTSGVFRMRFIPSTNQLISTCAKGQVRIWNLPDFTLTYSADLVQGRSRGLAVSTNGSWFATGSADGMVRLFDAKTMDMVAVNRDHLDAVNALCFDLGNQHLYSAGKDAHIHKYQFKSGMLELKERIPAHNYAIYDLLISPKDDLLVSCSMDKTIKIWNPDLGIVTRLDRKNHQGHTHSVNTLLLLESNLLLSAGDDRRIISWSVPK